MYNKRISITKSGDEKKLLLKRKELNSTIVVRNIYCSYLKGYVNNVGPFMKGRFCYGNVTLSTIRLQKICFVCVFILKL